MISPTSGSLTGILLIGNPVAPAFNGRGTLEVNRLCIRRDVPRALAWNAASMLYGWSAREAERRGWSRIITYTRADGRVMPESGCSTRCEFKTVVSAATMSSPMLFCELFRECLQVK